MGDPNSPRAEWSDRSRENENENENENDHGHDLEDPFEKFAGFRPNSDEEDNNRTIPAMFKARPPVPSEASDVDAATKTLFEELQAITSSNSKFPAFGRDRVLLTAAILTRNDILSIEAFRTTGETAR